MHNHKLADIKGWLPPVQPGTVALPLWNLGRLISQQITTLQHDTAKHGAGIALAVPTLSTVGGRTLRTPDKWLLLTLEVIKTLTAATAECANQISVTPCYALLLYQQHQQKQPNSHGLQKDRYKTPIAHTNTNNWWTTNPKKKQIM